MKISYKWLQELLPDLKVKPSDLADKLTFAGLEVEEFVDQKLSYHNIVVGLVTSKKKHPNADRLNVCQVSNSKETFEIVCGAANVEEGGKYPLALLGAKLPNGLEIQKVKIRDVTSIGMLCSQKELGLAQESQGLLELDKGAKVGQDFSKHFGLDDVIFEIALTPNRGDCLSHIGVAREIAALYGLKFKKPVVKLPKGNFENSLKVNLKDKKGCLRYCSRLIRNVKIGLSSQLISRRLENLGVRSINNVVDATNYVMLLTGHPLHAFDYRFIEDKKIEIRKSDSQTEIVTLDNEKHPLLKDDLIIADGKKAIALAGIMGGQNSEVKEDTTTLVLEAASFDAVTIQKTARRLGIHTESSHRFERVVPAETVKEALDTLTSIILQTAGGDLSLETIDIYPQKKKPLKLLLRQTKLKEVLGFSPSATEVISILKKLDLNPKKTNSGYQVVIPPHRSDITREIDLVEEVIRIYGFDQIQSELPKAIMRPVFESKISQKEEEIFNILTSKGFIQTIHYSFVGLDEVEKVFGELQSVVKLTNPLSQDLAVMRPSLLPQLLNTYIKNSKNQNGLRLFECRKIYESIPKSDEKIAVEKPMLSILFGGELYPNNWSHVERTCNFFDGKSLLEEILNSSKIKNLEWKAEGAQPLFHPHQSLIVKKDNELIATLGKIHPEILSRYKIKEELYYLEIDYGKLCSFWSEESVCYQEISPYPEIKRDLGLVVDQTMSQKQILKAIEDLNVNWLKEVSLFDLYQGENLPEGKKSLTYSLIYESNDRTLTDDEVNKTHFELVDKLRAKLGVELR